MSKNPEKDLYKHKDTGEIKSMKLWGMEYTEYGEDIGGSGEDWGLWIKDYLVEIKISDVPIYCPECMADLTMNLTHFSSGESITEDIFFDCTGGMDYDNRRSVHCDDRWFECDSCATRYEDVDIASIENFLRGNCMLPEIFKLDKEDNV